MAVSSGGRRRSGWLLLTFRLPSSQASRRVEMWRKIKRTGALPLHGTGHLLPDTATHHERFEWLASAIRSYGGDATVLHVSRIDKLPDERLAAMFVQERSREYEAVLRELRRLVASPTSTSAQWARLRRRVHELNAIDFFRSPIRDRVEGLLAQQDARVSGSGRAKPASYLGRTWVTRPRPGIDRAASAWLIRRFIDPDATFAFVAAGHPVPAAAVPYDMFHVGGFTHEADRCTFETLVNAFRIRDPRVAALAEAIHDADLRDQKFGRLEATGLDRVLDGWEKQDLSDKELLRRGMELIEGLYRSIERSTPRRSIGRRRRRGSPRAERRGAARRETGG